MKRRHRGMVIADSCKYTVRVDVERVFRHAQYGKTLRRTVVCYAHDCSFGSKIGDFVEIVECRPMSRTKRWSVVSVIGN